MVYTGWWVTEGGWGYTLVGGSQREAGGIHWLVGHRGRLTSIHSYVGHIHHMCTLTGQSS